MKTLLLLVAILAVVLVDIAPVAAPVPAHAVAATPELVGGRKWFACAAALTLLVGGVVLQQYYAAAAGAILFPTACALGW